MSNIFQIIPIVARDECSEIGQRSQEDRAYDPVIVRAQPLTSPVLRAFGAPESCQGWSKLCASWSAWLRWVEEPLWRTLWSYLRASCGERAIVTMDQSEAGSYFYKPVKFYGITRSGVQADVVIAAPCDELARQVDASHGRM